MSTTLIVVIVVAANVASLYVKVRIKRRVVHKYYWYFLYSLALTQESIDVKQLMDSYGLGIDRCQWVIARLLRDKLVNVSYSSPVFRTSASVQIRPEGIEMFALHRDELEYAGWQGELQRIM